MVNAEHACVFLPRLTGVPGGPIHFHVRSCLVSGRVSVDDLADGWVYRPGAERRAGHIVAECLADPLAQTFVIGEEKCAISDNRAAHVSSELVQPEGLLGRIEGIASVEDIVADEFKDAAVKFVRARFRYDVDL